MSADPRLRDPNREQLRLLLEAMPSGIVVIEPSGKIVMINGRLETLFGYSREELVGKPIEVLVPERFRANHVNYRDEFLGNPLTRSMGSGRDLFGVRKDGSEFPVEIGLSSIEMPEGVFVLGAVVDISERKGSEEALLQSQERVRLIVDSSLDAIVTIDEQGKVTDWNPRAEKIFGWRNDEAVGRVMVDLIVPERYRQKHTQGLRHFLATGEGPVLNKRLELSAVRRTGEEFPIELTISPIKIGPHYEFSAFLSDISERKRLEERFRASVESAPTAMVMIDAGGKIILVNRETEKLFGYQRDELMGQPVEILVPKQLQAGHPQLRDGFFAKPQARRMGVGRDLFGLRKDGSEFPVEIGLNPVETAEGLFVLSAIADITERKRFEERFRATIESAPTAMVMIDAQGKIVLVNRETEKLFGYQRDELMGQPVEILVPKQLQAGHPQLRDGFFAKPQARRMGAGRDLFGLRKDGGEFPVEIGLNPVETAEGLFVLAGIIDISERYRAAERLSRAQRLAALNLAQDAEEARRRAERNEEALASANRELQGEITQRQWTEVELRRASTELARSNAELEQFAYIASHDLQEPLRKVQSFGDLLAVQAGPALGDEEREYLKRMQSAATRMQTLIVDLLTFARVTSQAKPFVPVDLNQVVQEVLSDLETRIKSSGGRVEVGQLPQLDSDPLQMRQLLQNLIGNALKFHRPNVPPVLVVDSRLVQPGDGPALEHPRSGQICEITVRDNGIGFEETYLDRIFMPFQRLHGRGEYEGTGMGLAICRKIVERHGGAITAHSTPGQGTTFIVLLPLRQPNGESHHA